MRRFKITISYDGTNYAGWQVQPNDITVQEKIEAAVRQITTKKVKVHGSGRTDQGVHAKKQVAHFDLDKKITVHALHKGLNAVLPQDIRIMDLKVVPSTFHARYSVVKKEYRYFIWNSEVMPPFDSKYKMHIRSSLDIKAMQKAAGYLVGCHDFSSFTANSRKELDDPVRRLFELKVVKRGSDVVITAIGEGFLYKMVRSLTGFLIKVGKGTAKPSDARKILKCALRTAKVPTAPAHGLFLWNVKY